MWQAECQTLQRGAIHLILQWFGGKRTRNNPGPHGIPLLPIAQQLHAAHWPHTPFSTVPAGFQHAEALPPEPQGGYYQTGRFSRTIGFAEWLPGVL